MSSPSRLLKQITSFFRHDSHQSQTGRCSRCASSGPHVRSLRLEPLEERALLSAVDWDGAGFQLYTDETLQTRGLSGSYVDQSLRSYSTQDDWRESQTIAGNRVDSSIQFIADGWGTRSEVGLSHGNEQNWEDFSVQWDGVIQVFEPTMLATLSDDSSRMWIDVNQDGIFDSETPEFVDNNWGSGACQPI